MAAAVMTTGTFPKLLWPGLHALWGSEYPEHEWQMKDLYEFEKSSKAFEELQELVSLGMVPVKGEGAPIIFDSMSQGVTNRSIHVAYGLGAIITREAIDDNQYENLAEKAVVALKFAHKQTRETVFALTYDRMFSGSFVYADGVSGISASHPTASGLQSNLLASSAQLSDVAIEDLTVQMMNALDSKGHKIQVMPKSLHIPTAEYWNATRILNSELKHDTAENAINALKYRGIFKGGAIVNNYFGSTTAWFIRADIPNSLVAFDRVPLEIDHDNDFQTSNHLIKTYIRYSMILADWRGIWGSPGA